MSAAPSTSAVSRPGRFVWTLPLRLWLMVGATGVSVLLTAGLLAWRVLSSAATAAAPGGSAPVFPWAILLGGTAASLVVLGVCAAAVRQGLQQRAGELLRVVQANADGDLSVQVRMTGNDDLGRIGQAVEAMNANLSGMVGQIRSEAIRVAMASDGIAQSNRDLAQRTDRAASSLKQTAATVQGLADSVRSNADGARAAGELAGRLHARTSEGLEGMAQAVRTIQDIRQSSARMADIIGVIDGIAFQTNILALNAAVEAARAGEQGRGFAVVAAEVRNLARRCADSAREVRELIERSGSRVIDGARDIGRAHDVLGEMAGGIGDLAGEVARVAQSTQEQSQSLGEIAEAVGELDRITQQNAAMVDDTLREAEALRVRSANLGEAVGEVRLRRATADEALAMVRRAANLVRQRGLPAATSEFHTPNGAFRDRDLYIFVFNREGLFTVYGADPVKAGRATVHDLPDLDGNHLYQAGWEAAGRGGDWIEYTVTSPTTGVVEPKMTYILPVDEQHVMGCGVYKPVIQRRQAVPRLGTRAAPQVAPARAAVAA